MRRFAIAAIGVLILVLYNTSIYVAYQHGVRATAKECLK